MAGRSRMGDSSLYAVYDGHGGSKASQFCRDCLLPCVLSQDSFESNPRSALLSAFEK